MQTSRKTFVLVLTATLLASVGLIAQDQSSQSSSDALPQIIQKSDSTYPPIVQRKNTQPKKIAPEFPPIRIPEGSERFVEPRIRTVPRTMNRTAQTPLPQQWNLQNSNSQNQTGLQPVPIQSRLPKPSNSTQMPLAVQNQVPQGVFSRTGFVGVENSSAQKANVTSNTPRPLNQSPNQSPVDAMPMEAMPLPANASKSSTTLIPVVRPDDLNQQFDTLPKIISSDQMPLPYNGVVKTSGTQGVPLPMNGPQGSQPMPQQGVTQTNLPPIVSNSNPTVTTDQSQVIESSPIVGSSQIIYDPMPRVPTEAEIRNANKFAAMTKRLQDQGPVHVPTPAPQPQVGPVGPVVQNHQPDTFFDQPVELGKGLPKYSGGMSVLGDTGSMNDCACGTCQATTGCDSPRCQYDVNSVCNAFNCCGYIAGAKQYYIGEVLYWFNETESVVGSTFFSTGNLDGAVGGRITIGQKEGVTGREFVYTGLSAFVSNRTRTSAFVGMSANFSTAIFPFALTAPFINAVAQNQRLKTRFHSVELNRTWWGWDVIKSHVGLRYMYYAEDYRLLSSNFFGAGSFDLLTENHFIGPEIGIDFFYDVGRRTAFTFSGSIGGGANFHRGGFEAFSNGLKFVDVQSSSAKLQWNFQLAVSAHWKLGPRSRLVAGYDVLGLFEVANARNNFPAILSPAAGANLVSNDEAFLHGASFGIEIYR